MLSSSVERSEEGLATEGEVDAFEIRIRLDTSCSPVTLLFKFLIVKFLPSILVISPRILAVWEEYRLLLKVGFEGGGVVFVI